MPFKGGVKEAAKMLSGLDPMQREKVLLLIAREDPNMAELLRKNMVELADLLYLTPLMIQELLREINLVDLGLALRLGPPELRDHFLQNVSRAMREDIEEVLKGPPQAVSKIQESAERILQIVREKVEKGQIVINRSGSGDQLV